MRETYRLFATDTSIAGAPSLLPFFLGRISALPTDDIEQLASAALADALRHLDEADRRFAEERENISARLHDAIGACNDKNIRNALLGLRRDLFNGKIVPANRLEAGVAMLEPALGQGVRALHARIAARIAQVEEIRALHGTALIASRRHLQRVVGDSSFQKGLLLSSPTLHANLARYCKRNPDEFVARDEQIERGLLRYVTRTAMKATPFAALCAILPGSFSKPDADRALVSFDGNPRAHRSFVRLNKRLYGWLWSHLKTRPAVRRALRVDLNPTLRKQSDRWLFLTERGGSEVFQRLACSEALELVVAAMRTESTTLGQLANHLSTSPEIDASVDEAEMYLNQLLDIGLLRFRSAVAEQTADWDVPLRDLIRGIDDEHVAEVLTLLEKLRAAADVYATASVPDRDLIMREVQSGLAVARERMGVGALEGGGDLPLYEDMTADAAMRVPYTPAVALAIRDFAALMAALSRHAPVRNEQATMRHFFDVQYGADAAVPLLRFYEDYYREHFKEHLAREARAKGGRAKPEEEAYDIGNPFNLESIRESRRRIGQLKALAVAHWTETPQAEEIRIPMDAILDTIGIEPTGSRTLSASAFCQLMTHHDGSVRVIMPSGFNTGLGKYFSRFLYMFSPDVQRLVAEENANLTADCLAEICGDAHFNGNLHPPLLQTQISYPTAESPASESMCSAADLVVAADPDDPSVLSLRHVLTSRRIFPNDLGFLTPMKRPPLFQMLAKFSPSPSGGVPLPDRLPLPTPSSAEESSDAVAAPPSVTYRPRIVFGESVVVARRCWSIPMALFPRPTGGESSADFFLRVHRWRSEHGIPSQVYVSIIPDGRRPPPADAPAAESDATLRSEEDETGVASSDNELSSEAANAKSAPNPAVPQAAVAKSPSRTKSSRDWRKPQFIDFASPVLVQLFGKLPGTLSGYHVRMYERYPGAGSLPSHDGQRFAMELVVQIGYGRRDPNGAHAESEAVLATAHA